MSETYGSTAALETESVLNVSRMLHDFAPGSDPSADDAEKCRFVDDCSVFSSDYACNATKVNARL